MIAVAFSGTKLDGRRARGDRTRAAILQRAIEIASTNGLEGLTMGRLAGDLGSSKSNLGVLFGDKEALQLAVVDAAAQRFVEIVVTPAHVEQSALGCLRALCDGWYTYLESKIFPGGCFIYATAHEYRARPGKIRDRVLSYFDLWKRTLGAQVRTGLQNGEIRLETNARETVWKLVAYQNAAHLAILLDDPTWLDQSRQLTRAHIEALAIRAQGAEPERL
ncbi:MAG TPA: TetR/AcrR family transcriptional regulator [Candidatus Acidoferrales bacterium]|nr:TetR/AcrR family transcriptional regulator [Candidatus Acidoferrales bacterium]